MLSYVIYIGLAALFAYLVYRITDSYGSAFLNLFMSILLTPIAGFIHLLIEYLTKKDIEKWNRRR